MRWAHPKIPGAQFRVWTSPPEAKEQEKTPAISVADPQMVRSDERPHAEVLPYARPHTDQASKDLPFLGIIHVGAGINYVPVAQGHRPEENTEDSGEADEEGRSEGLELDEELIGQVEPEDFNSRDEVVAFAYCRFNSERGSRMTC